MADVDIVLKEFWTDKRIAALFNAVFFEEEPVIQADTLHEANPELAASFWNSEIRPIVANRWRDVVRIWTIEWENETYEVLLHMENQKKIDYTTPARIMSHQALDQLREIRKTLDDRQTDPDGTKRASLPSFRRDDRIRPSASITVYYGDQPWNASKRRQIIVQNLPADRSYVRAVSCQSGGRRARPPEHSGPRRQGSVPPAAHCVQPRFSS